MLLPATNGSSNSTPNQLPNCFESLIARHTRSCGARSRTLFSIRSVLELIRNLQVAFRITARESKRNPRVAERRRPYLVPLPAREGVRVRFLASSGFQTQQTLPRHVIHLEPNPVRILE